MKIIETGKSYSFDKDDCLIADNSSLVITDKWISATADFISLINKDYVDSIYIRGSAASGHTIDNVSDLDFIVVYREQKHVDQLNHVVKEEFDEYKKTISDMLLRRYKFITDIHIDITSRNVQDDDLLTIKHLSTCIYGESLAPILPVVTKQDLKTVEIFYDKVRQEFDEMLKGNISKQYMCRALLRLTFMLVFQVHEDKVWTRDLYQCYKHSSKIYPEQKERMEFILQIAIKEDVYYEDDFISYKNPRENTILINYEEWLYNELLKYKMINNASENTI